LENPPICPAGPSWEKARGFFGILYTKMYKELKRRLRKCLQQRKYFAKMNIPIGLSPKRFLKT